MKVVLLYIALILFFSVSCSKKHSAFKSKTPEGIYATIDGVACSFNRNKEVSFHSATGVQNGIPYVLYMFDIQGYATNPQDSFRITVGMGSDNKEISTGKFQSPDYQNKLVAVGIDYGTKSNSIHYRNGSDEVYGARLVISTLTQKRIIGTFEGELGGSNLDTLNPKEKIIIKGTFNLPINLLTQSKGDWQFFPPH
ncbi:MAG: hypothetical protein ABL929_10345 [Ferruginibacter sp.]